LNRTEPAERGSTFQAAPARSSGYFSDVTDVRPPFNRTANAWAATPEHQRIAEANRQFYATVANLYDRTETCVADPTAQRQIEDDLDRVIQLTGRPPGELRAMDACGGSGNISLKLLRRGLQTTLVDISPELQEIFRQKCARAGYHPQVVQSEIGAFLAVHREPFDLIVFSSALHHLQDVDGVLSAAFHQLTPGGLLLTLFDPTSRAAMRPWTRRLLRLDYYAFKVRHQTADLPGALLRRMRRKWPRATSDNKTAMALDHSTAGVLAEYHVEKGIDDFALLQRLKTVGFDVLWHLRSVDCRFAIIRRLVERSGDRTAFKLLLRRPATAPRPDPDSPHIHRSVQPTQ
jgi:ubiquinone/menaquinone biosynthesis C-methylase UbiE